MVANGILLPFAAICFHSCFVCFHLFLTLGACPSVCGAFYSVFAQLCQIPWAKLPSTFGQFYPNFRAALLDVSGKVAHGLGLTFPDLIADIPGFIRHCLSFLAYLPYYLRIMKKKFGRYDILLYFCEQ